MVSRDRPAFLFPSGSDGLLNRHFNRPKRRRSWQASNALPAIWRKYGPEGSNSTAIF